MPVITSPATARADYRDRSPVQRSNASSVNPGAAARVSTTDWTYTCPTGKKGQVELMFAMTANRNAAPLNALARGTITFQPNGGSTATILVSEMYTGELSISRPLALAGAKFMLVGDAIRGTSRSDNTGAGSDVTIDTTAQITEYDA